MAIVKIDTNIPAPNGNHRLKYPFAEMNVGDSFFVAGKQPSQLSSCTGRVAPKRFVARTVTEDGVKGARVWRIQ